jgi:hypothetical protein
MDPPKKASVPTETDKRLLHMYGMIPTRGNLLHGQLEVEKRSKVLLAAKYQANSTIDGREESISIPVTLPSRRLISPLTSAAWILAANTPCGKISRIPQLPYPALVTLMTTLTSHCEVGRRLRS